MSRLLAIVTAVALGLSLAAAARAQTEEGSPIRYTTRFVHPGPAGQNDFTLENYIIEQINATPAGAQIAFAARDWTRTQVATAVVNAHNRGVDIIGVIDGSEKDRLFLQTMVNTVGGGRIIFCGSPTFAFFSCISNTRVPGLMHNKFWTFSELNDGSKNVVLQTSQNFTGPQLHLFQDLVRIDNDAALYDAYRTYVLDMKAQERSDHYFKFASGDDGRNTMYPFPRFQPDEWTNDTVVERLNEVDCSDGPDGHGLIRVGQFGFRTARMVVAQKLVELKKAGCVVEVVNSNGDPDIVATLVNAGIAYFPLFNGITDVSTHTKLWVTDAKSTLTGTRTKVAYMGSANWRQFQNQTEDVLLRIVDDGVYDAYQAYWVEMRDRAGYTRGRPPAVQPDVQPPFTAFSPSSEPNAAGWYRSDVAIRITGSDGIGDQEENLATGMKSLKVELTGAQSGISELAGAAYSVSLTDTPVVSAEGRTTVSFSSVDHKGNQSAVGTVEVKIDKTAPTVSLVGGPADGESYYFGSVAAAPSCSASDALSDLDGSCTVSGYSAAVGSHTVTASARDNAGNLATASADYTVLAWTLNGFYRPVDMGNVVNTVKNGATVPLKFEIFSGSNELTDPANVLSLSAKQVSCASLSDEPTDAIEVTATGGTSLRYDPTSGQFIHNWKTPEKPDSCYRVRVTTDDGSRLDAFFKLK